MRHGIGLSRALCAVAAMAVASACGGGGGGGSDGGIGPLQQEAFVKASNTDDLDFFGTSVAVSGDTLVVGAPGEDGSGTGVNPGPAAEADDGAINAGAVYVYVRSGSTWTQQAYLKASDATSGDRFGEAVAISGNTLVVGAPEHESGGAAYVFVRSGTVWTEQDLLQASNADDGDGFGGAVSVSGETLVVAAEFEESAATGVNAGVLAEADDTAPDAGAAYVFVRSGSTWSQQAYLKASNTDGDDRFGYSIALSGATVVVGAIGESSGATGPNPGVAAEADDSASESGAAYVFVRSGTTWSQQAYLKASNTDAGDDFGVSVGISGDTLAVGAFLEASGAAGVNPGPAAEADDGTNAAGAAYVFVRSGSTWAQQAYLKASNPDDSDIFGSAIAVSGETVVVGAWGEASSATGVNGGALAEADDTATSAGAAYAFVRSGATWTQHSYVKASNTDLGDRFGAAVAVDDDTVVVGAMMEESTATGVNPGPAAEADDGATTAGAAYVLR